MQSKREGFCVDKLTKEPLTAVIYAEESLVLILSDSNNLTSEVLVLDIPALDKDAVNIVELEISKEDRLKLSNIKSVGIKALSTITATFNIIHPNLEYSLC